MKRVIKWFFVSILTLVLVVVFVGVAFLNLSPQFGGTASEEQKRLYEATGHFANGIFLNDEEIVMELNCHSITAMLKETMNPDPDVAPHQNIEVQKVKAESLVSKHDSTTRITWLGHSSFLIELGDKRILIDLVFGQYAAPHHWLGRVRFNKEMPIEIAELPEIDAVVISHDHYDHLDYPSIDQLRSKVNHFFVPLGVGNHLRRWEIEEGKITEMDWWQEEEYEDLNIILTPARHMSGRALSDQSATLWGSWIMQDENTKIYFSGDGGYGKHFKEIGEKYGPFDVGLMECGQYNELWRDVHMMPEESVIAAGDVKAEFIVPVHWGSFALATHSWTDPVERITKAAQEMNVPIATPRIGEPIVLNETAHLDFNKWWLGEAYAMNSKWNEKAGF